MSKNDEDDDEIVLDYHDSLLHVSDLKLLNAPNWLNDRLIGFVYEYFEYEKYANITNQLAFVNPSVLQFIKLDANFDELVACFFEPLNLKNKTFIFLPINDNRDATRSGGSHWSLLFINKLESKFTHYDSFSASNRATARGLYAKLKVYFECNVYIDEPNCPQQINTSDCGMYVIAITDFIADFIQKSNDAKQINLMQIIPDYIKNQRIYFKNLILKLSKQ